MGWCSYLLGLVRSLGWPRQSLAAGPLPERTWWAPVRLFRTLRPHRTAVSLSNSCGFWHKHATLGEAHQRLAGKEKGAKPWAVCLRSEQDSEQGGIPKPLSSQPRLIPPRRAQIPSFHCGPSRATLGRRYSVSPPASTRLRPNRWPSSPWLTVKATVTAQTKH